MGGGHSKGSRDYEIYRIRVDQERLREENERMRVEQERIREENERIREEREQERERREQEGRERREQERRDRARIGQLEQERRDRERIEQERNALEVKKKEARKAFTTAKTDIKTSELKKKEETLSELVSTTYSQAKSGFTEDILLIPISNFLRENCPIRIRDVVIKKVNEVTLKAMSNIKHSNALVIGKTGVGKSTLLNVVLKLIGDEAAATGIGLPVTQDTEMYESEKVRIWDMRGIELKKYGVDAAIMEAKRVVDKMAAKNDPDMCIHAIWYCINTQSGRIEDSERDALLELMNIYDGGNLPIIVVLTQACNDEGDEEKKDLVGTMENAAKEIVRERVTHIVPVLAKKMHGKEPHGFDNLLEVTNECAKKAAVPALRHSVKIQVENMIKEDHNNEFCARMLSKLSSIIKESLEMMDRKSSFDDKLLFIRNILARIICLWFNDKDPSKYAGYLDNIMGEIRKWAIDPLKIIDSDLSTTTGNDLPGKYKELKDRIESARGCQDCGINITEAAASDKMEIIDILKKKAEDIAIKEISEHVVNVFIGAFVNVINTEVSEILSSEDTLKIIDDIIKRANGDEQK